MKKYLLTVFFVLIFSTLAIAGVPVKRSGVKVNSTTQVQRKSKPQARHEVNTMRIPGSPLVNEAPKREASLENWYDRPAGAFFVGDLSINGSFGYSYQTPFLFMKPFANYTYRGHVNGADENTHVAWDIFKYDSEENSIFPVDDKMEANVTYGIEISKVPIFYAIDGDPDDENSTWYDYQMGVINNNGSPENPVVDGSTPFNVFSVPADVLISGETDVDYWCSSKSLIGRSHRNDYPFVYYSGAVPADGNQAGWWFGKNGQHIDGIAQAFEKPSKPYLLKKVGLFTITNVDRLNADNAKLTCKVYKLDGIPAYDDSSIVQLPEIPGELIVSGEGYITQSTIEDNVGFVEFTLFDADEEDPELTFEYTPTIDSPILVVIEGYNDNDAIGDFTSCISSNYNEDEGYGELAYLKCPVNTVRLDENGDTVFDGEGKPVYDFTGKYNWLGLNNFFRSGAKKTGMAIFLSAENPFITFNNLFEDGEYTFPPEGGVLGKNVEYESDTFLIEGIDYYSWYGSEDYILTWNGIEELPDWLSIRLEDIENYESGWEVNASVTAEPLPADLAYREAIVRFTIPGDYIDYKFMQGKKDNDPINDYDVNFDGEITIADVNKLINIMLSGGSDVVTIAVINSIIDKILTQEPYRPSNRLGR